MWGGNDSGVMKYHKKTKTYRASNVWFDPIEMEAYSYDWWQFVRKINGKVIFNDYNYSLTTSRHQRKVISQMDDLGIKIDLVVYFRESLSHYSNMSLEELKKESDKQIKQREEEAKEARRESSRRSYQRKKEHLAKLKALEGKDLYMGAYRLSYLYNIKSVNFNLNNIKLTKKEATTYWGFTFKFNIEKGIATNIKQVAEYRDGKLVIPFEQEIKEL